MNDLQVTSAHTTNKPQGQIHTANPDLLSLLTEDSRDNLHSRPVPADSEAEPESGKSPRPIDVNNNRESARYEERVTSSRSVNATVKSPESQAESQTKSRVESRSESQSSRDRFPQPTPSADLPSGRYSSSSVTTVANPDIPRASVTPAKQCFPKYVSLKSRSVTSPRDSNPTAGTTLQEDSSEGSRTPVNSPGVHQIKEQTSQRSSPSSHRETPNIESVAEVDEPVRSSPPVSPSPVSPLAGRDTQKAEDIPAVQNRHSPTGISTDSLDVRDSELGEHLKSPEQASVWDSHPGPATTPPGPTTPAVVVVEEDTSVTRLSETTPSPEDPNHLQVPQVRSTQLKSRNPQSPEGFERDSLSSSVDVEELRRLESSTSGRSRVFLVRDEPQDNMSRAGTRKVYVESPTFTKDEEDEFRFVSSRLDDYNDVKDTYRQLDENTVEQNTKKKKSSGKRVRYQDTDADSFEDKNHPDSEGDARSGQRSNHGNDVTVRSALKNSSRQEYETKPVTPLNNDDDYDSNEQDELERETFYQDTLKQRIKRDFESTDVPSLDLTPDGQFTQDSLDMAGESYRQDRGSKPRDSLELYHDKGADPGSKYGEMENTNWQNPPPQPFSAPVYDDASPGYQRDGYASEPDYQYQPRRDVDFEYPEPQSTSEPGYQYQGAPEPEQPQYYQDAGQDQNYTSPQYQNPGSHRQYYQGSPQAKQNFKSPERFQSSGYNEDPRGYGPQTQQQAVLVESNRMNQSYDSEPSYRPVYSDYDQTNQNGGQYYNNDQNGGNESGYYDARLNVAGRISNPKRQGERYVNENVEPAKQEGPLKPRYNYVANNKYDYGKHPQKSYKQIKDIRNEEKVKLESLFIKPKLKPKHSGSMDNVSARTANSDREHDPLALNQKPASAEDLWAKRAASLQNRSSRKQPGTKKYGSKLVKYPNESGIPQQIAPLPRPAFLPPAGPASGSLASGQSSFPPSPTRRVVDLKPISQEVVTADGQRISVDVKLRLVSPPPTHYHSDGYLAGTHQYAQDVADQGPAVRKAHQYPIGDYPNQQDYSEAYSDPYSLPQREDASYSATSLPKIETQGFGGNSFAKVPPIPNSSDSKHHSPTVPNELEDGYVAQFRKQREKQQGDHPWYKVYTINDYKKMQKEVRLGTLGPDLDREGHRERMEKAQRQSHYARMVMEKNKQELVHKKPPPFPKPQEQQDDILNKRKVALEYAKQVPKPQVRQQANSYNSYDVSSQVAVGSTSSVASLTRRQYKQPVVDVIDLDKLQQRHERDKENVAKIRQNMDSVVA